MDDLISRQDAIEYLMTNMNWYDEDGYESDDDYKRECITELINGVPSARPERKKGKWIEVDDHYNRISGRCSACGWEALLYETDVVGMDFCPNCGAKMNEIT